VTPWLVVDGLAEAVEVAGGLGTALVVDLENTLVDYGSSADDRLVAMSAALDAVVADGRLERLAFLSNGRFSAPLPVLSHPAVEVEALAGARKPYVRLPPLRRLRADLAGAAVFGDQPLTDGRLARNLGGVWLQPRHAVEASPDEPWWPRVMRRRGARVVRRHFTPSTPAGAGEAGGAGGPDL
jgi:predicted HAD superfamily phosphohydrolase YqeG